MFASCNVLALPLVVAPYVLWIPSDLALVIVAIVGVGGSFGLAWLWIRFPMAAASIQCGLLVMPMILIFRTAEGFTHRPRWTDFVDIRFLLALLLFVTPAALVAASIIVLLRRRQPKSKDQLGSD
jgi:hypothetical protein